MDANLENVLLLAILALVVAACGPSGSSPSAAGVRGAGRLEGGEPSAAPSEGAGEPVAGGTLVFAGARLSASLDPA